MMIQTQDPLTLMSALPDFRNTSHIFLPINDCRAPNVPEGGSHWSLLLVSVLDNSAFHYDSLRQSNLPAAQMACHKISIILQRPLRFMDLADAPQQENGRDCGVFVCLVMEYLLTRKLLVQSSKDQVSMSLRGKDIDAAKGRRKMMSTIEGFRREGMRSSSRSKSPGARRGHSPRGSPPRIGD